jgi:hypothetical protein
MKFISNQRHRCWCHLFFHLLNLKMAFQIRYFYSILLSRWFFFGQPIWRVTRSLDRVNDRVGFQNYGYNMWGKHYTFPRNYFFLWFSPKLSFTIWFFNIELVKNYSYNMWGKHCTLHRKLLWIDTVFFPIKFFFLFFYVFFLKLSLLILFF